MRARVWAGGGPFDLEVLWCCVCVVGGWEMGRVVEGGDAGCRSGVLRQGIEGRKTNI